LPTSAPFCCDELVFRIDEDGGNEGRRADHRAIDFDGCTTKRGDFELTNFLSCAVEPRQELGPCASISDRREIEDNLLDDLARREPTLRRVSEQREKRLARCAHANAAEPVCNVDGHDALRGQRAPLDWT